MSKSIYSAVTDPRVPKSKAKGRILKAVRDQAKKACKKAVRAGKTPDAEEFTRDCEKNKEFMKACGHVGLTRWDLFKVINEVVSKGGVAVAEKEKGKKVEKKKWWQVRQIVWRSEYYKKLVGRLINWGGGAIILLSALAGVFAALGEIGLATRLVLMVAVLCGFMVGSVAMVLLINQRESGDEPKTEKQ